MTHRYWSPYNPGLRDFLQTRAVKIFLTGNPGIGKSTAAQKIVAITKKECFGFVTKRVPNGFDIIDLYTGESAPIARRSPDGRLEIFPQSFETLGVESLNYAKKPNELVLMDELGRFELLAPKFTEKVIEVIRGPLSVIAVVKEESNKFLDVVRMLAEAHLFRITPYNREKIVLDILEFIREDVLVS